MYIKLIRNQAKYTTLWGYVFNEVYQSWEG